VSRAVLSGNNKIALIKQYGLRAGSLVAARGVAMAMNFVSTIWLARLIGPDRLGALTANQSILATVSQFVALGIPLFALRAAALKQDKAVGFALALNLATSLIIALAGLALAVIGTPLGWLLTILLGVWSALEKNQEIRVGLGMECGAARLVNALILCKSIVALAAVGIAAFLPIEPLSIYIIGITIGSAISALVLWNGTNYWKPTLKRPRDGSLAILPGMMIGDALGSLSNLDTWIVQRFGGTLNAGLYGAMLKFRSPVGILSSSLRLVLMGPASRGSRQRQRRILSTLLIIMVIATLVAFAITPFSARIVDLLLGPEFTEAAGALFWVILVLPAFAIMPLVITLLLAQGKSVAVAINSGVWNVILLAGISLTVAYQGATGAAMALAFATWGRAITGAILAYMGTLPRYALLAENDNLDSQVDNLTQ